MMSDNGRAALLMTLSMGLFALEDSFIKQLTTGMPVYQVLVMLGVAGAGLFWLKLAQTGRHLWTPDLLHPVVILRSLGEVAGAVCYVTALATGDLASASAILQMLPLLLVLGGWLFLGESVGWRRWSSVLVGFLGVMMILRPGSAAFQPAALWALASVVALMVRDLATRRVPARVPSDLLSASAYAIIVPGGILLGLIQSEPVVTPRAIDWAMLAGSTVFGVIAYAALVTASRIGEASAVAPFRYTRLGFALLIAVLVFGERPDTMTLAGAALIALAGGYSMWREAKLRRIKRLPPDGFIRPGEP